MGAAAIFILLVVVVVAAAIGGALYALRTGFWLKETSAKATTEEHGRPEHTVVEDEGGQSLDVPGTDRR